MVAKHHEIHRIKAKNAKSMSARTVGFLIQEIKFM